MRIGPRPTRTPVELRQFVDSEILGWARVVSAAGIKPD